MSPRRRLASVALACVLVPALLPGARVWAADPWSQPQTISAAPASDPHTALAETADGTLVAVTRDTAGDFVRSTRAPGEDWVVDGVFTPPDGVAPQYVDGVAVTPDGAAWLAYRPQGSYDVRVARWDPDGSSEMIGGFVQPWTTVELIVDDEGDVLLTYGERGGAPLAAVYGDATEGLDSLDVPSWTGTQRPHQWALGPGDTVVLVSRYGTRIRAVDVGRGTETTTRTFDRPGGPRAGLVAATVAPSGTQYAAWTTAPAGGPRTVWLARRPAGGEWLRPRVVDRRGKGSRPHRSLALASTAGGAYLAWVQPGREASSIRGALVRRQRPVRAQQVAGPRAVGVHRGRRIALDVGRRGRLLVAWTVVGDEGVRHVSAALGRVRGAPTVARLFGVDAIIAPIALLRAAGAATVAGSSPTTTAGGAVVRSASTD